MRFAVFCKSFRQDLERCERLVESFERYNSSRLPLFLSVPRCDRAAFENRLGTRVTYMSDEEVLQRELPQNWHTQQLVKLSIFRTGFADAWLWIDSDCYFIRPFTLADFVRADGSVAMVATRTEHALDENWECLTAFLQDESALPVTTSEELCIFERAPRRHFPRFQRLYDALFRPEFDSRLSRCGAFFGRTNVEFGALPGAVWTHDSLQSFVREVLEPRQMTFERLLSHAPWEARWIAEWELFRGLNGRHLIHPPLVHIRLDETIRKARTRGLRESDFARRYLGIQLAARHQDFLTLDERGHS